MSLDGKFIPHTEKQERAIFAEKRILLLGAGTQWGKTRVGAVRMKLKNFLYTSSDDNFIITSPSYKTMMQSTLPYYLKIMEGWGRHDKKLECFELNTGGHVWFRTETDPDSIVGITNVRHIWGDEAGKYRLYFWENMQNRADFCGCGIDLTTSPYSRNWIYKELIKPTLSLERSDVEYVQAASWENPYHSLSDPVKLAEKKRTMDPMRFDMSYGGIFGQMAGLVYGCFSDTENIIAPFRLPNGTQYYAGIDWGHTEPFVIVVRAITPDQHHYQISEFYKTGMTIPEQMQVAKQKMAIFGIKQFFCGHERPENILYFNQNGIPAVAVPEKDIQIGTDLHYELIKTRRYQMFHNTSPYTLDEYESYHYPEAQDLEPDQDSTDQTPVGQNDHCMSANRFVTLKTHRSGLRLKPHAPEEHSSQRAETQEQRFKRLMRPSGDRVN